MSSFSVGPPRPPYIVLVDDNPVYLDTAKAFIEMELIGFTVFKALGPIEAIAIRNSLDGPAIFMADYQMPDMDGIRFLKYIKVSSRFRVYPYLVTAYDDHRILGESLRNGILYFSKNPPRDGDTFNLGDLYKDHIFFAVEQLKSMHAKDGLTGLDMTTEAFLVWKNEFVRAKRGGNANISHLRRYGRPEKNKRQRRSPGRRCCAAGNSSHPTKSNKVFL